MFPRDIGDMVHYVTVGSANGVYPVECCAAIVTGIYEGSEKVDITVFNKRGGSFPNREIPYNIDANEGTWHHMIDVKHIV